MDNPMLNGLRPHPSRDTKPYWDGLLEGRLLIQQCPDCGAFRHYPRAVCPACYSMEVEWVEMRGEATVHTWTTCYHAFHPAYKRDLPVTYVTVDLPEGPRLVGRLRDGDGITLKVGLPVKLGVEQIDAELALPIVRPA